MFNKISTFLIESAFVIVLSFLVIVLGIACTNIIKAII